MPTTQTRAESRTLQTVNGFFEAWVAKDIERTMSYVADDIVVDTPNGRVEGKDAYRQSMLDWFGLCVRAEVIDTFADGDRAVMIYDSETRVARSVPAMEYFVIEDGQISYKRLIFDRGPFIQAAQAA